MTVTKRYAGGVGWQWVALPTEHGGWGFISEPILLGLLLAPGWGGLALSAAAFAVFLLRQPLKIILKDFRNSRSVPRTDAARKFALIYGAIAVGAGIMMLLFLPTADALLPLVFALPFALIQLAADVQNRSRIPLAELAGAAATGGIASAIVMMGEWPLLTALGLWLALVVKSVTAVLYVRARLRLERGKPAASGLVATAHIVGFVVLVAAAARGLLTWTAPAAAGILLIRAAIGLSPPRKSQAPKLIGMQEMVYGLVFVLLIAVGYTFV